MRRTATAVAAPVLRRTATAAVRGGAQPALQSRAALPRAAARSLASPLLARDARRAFAASAAAPPDEVDLVIIGGGPGGYVAAIKAGQAGLKVACIEGRGALGGTCLNVGCIPSKCLLNTSHKYEDALKHFEPHGLKVEGVSVDVPKMIEAKNTRVKGLTGGIAGLFKKNKVDYVEGWGTIQTPTEVSVAMNDGSSRTLKTKDILIATGSDVASLPFIEIDEEVIISSTGALDLQDVPKSMVVIGGGVIGLEMGTVWQRLGTEVTVIEFMDAIAAGQDAEVAKEFLKVLKRQGMKFELKSGVTSAKRLPDGRAEVTYDNAKGQSKSITVDKVLVAVGRKPNTDGLGLENVGITTEKPGIIPIDDEFRTSVPSIRAIGDVVRGPMLAHKAEEEGSAAVEYITTGHGHVNYDAIPGVIYTHPEVASVGKTEEQLKEAGVNYKVGKFPFKANSRARTNNDDDGFVKFLADKDTDRLLGCHIIGPDAGELIHTAVFAIEYEASSEDLARMCFAHPTLGESVKEAALATWTKPVHF
jgi:dihydrolipoyl dehydrogenase